MREQDNDLWTKRADSSIQDTDQSRLDIIQNIQMITKHGFHQQNKLRTQYDQAASQILVMNDMETAKSFLCTILSLMGPIKDDVSMRKLCLAFSKRFNVSDQQSEDYLAAVKFIVISMGVIKDSVSQKILLMNTNMESCHSNQLFCHQVTDFKKSLNTFDGNLLHINKFLEPDCAYETKKLISNPFVKIVDKVRSHLKI